MIRGNGIVLAYHDDRFADRVEKLVWSSTGLTPVQQPFWSTVTEKSLDGFSFTPDRQFAITVGPGQPGVVANVATGNVVHVILEQVGTSDAPAARWFLVRLSSGLCGWATLDQLIASSDHLQMMNGAG